MRKIVMFVFIIFSFFIFSVQVNAAICDKADIVRLKELANIVDVNYEYIKMDSDEESENDYAVVDSYYIFVTNLTEELYIKTDFTEYRYSDVVDGTLMFTSNSGQLQLFIYTDRCPQRLLRTVTLNLPKFNTYSYRRECQDLKDLNLDFCDEWYQGYLDDKTFEQFLEPYINNEEIELSIFDKVINFFKNNYLFIVFGIVIILCMVMLMLRHRKRSVLE